MDGFWRKFVQIYDTLIIKQNIKIKNLEMEMLPESDFSLESTDKKAILKKLILYKLEK
ncbi:MAG: hypothetical protein K6F97_05960 [Lachnospiraceae bacterium]|nr:hypothetical protein [Lachnospiraceae bacterium]